MKVTNGLVLSGMVFISGISLHAQSRTVAMTVDDLPFASGEPRPTNPSDAKEAERVNRAILKAFSRDQIPVTGFVIEQGVESLGEKTGKRVLQSWTQAGFDLGNHLYSHPDVNSLSVEQIEQEITHREATFRPLLAERGHTPTFLRFPYNHTGDTAEKHDDVAAFMSAHGYKLAPCTIDNSDYEFNTAFVLALAHHDKQTAEHIRTEYVAYTGAEIDYYTHLNKTVLGYEPPQVMLLHDSPLNAAAISEVIALFQERGYKFVSLAQALTDPAYTIPETITKYGPMWGYRWAKERKVSVRTLNEPQPPSWIESYPKGAK